MRRSPALTVSALVLTLAFGVAGCSSSPSESSSSESSAESAASSRAVEIDAAPAAGETITGEGYSYSVPEGWKAQGTEVAPGTDTVAVDLTATGDFANNVNVVLSPAGALTPEQVEKRGAAELEGGGATDVTVLDRAIVAGSESAHLTAVMNSEGVSYRIHQYYLTNEKQTHVVTFSYAESVPDDQAIAIAESVLASWTWS